MIAFSLKMIRFVVYHRISFMDWERCAREYVNQHEAYHMALFFHRFTGDEYAVYIRL